MFGKEAYRDVIKLFIKKGYSFENFIHPSNSKTIYLRHDIDFSVRDAYEIAQIEKDLGVKSTYFFMLTSNTYNLMSEANRDLVEKIKNFGHHVSLHFDPVAYQDFDKGFSNERDLFEKIFNVGIDVVSIHRPGNFLTNNNRKLDRCIHTYEDRFFKEMIYISDSGGRNVTQKLEELAKSELKKPLHLLIHPIWWTSKSKSPTQTLNNWLSKTAKFLLQETRKNCKTFTS